MIRYPLGVKQNKYKNKKTEYRGIKFDSIKEKNRYLILKDMERLGQIEELQLQVKYELQPSYKIGNKKIRSINYIADFVYYKIYKRGGIEIREQIIEDVKPSKNFQTEVYKIKKKIFMYKYKKEITEIY